MRLENMRAQPGTVGIQTGGDKSRSSCQLSVCERMRLGMGGWAGGCHTGCRIIWESCRNFGKAVQQQANILALSCWDWELGCYWSAPLHNLFHPELFSFRVLHCPPELPSWQACLVSIRLLVKDAPRSRISCRAAKEPPTPTPCFQARHFRMFHGSVARLGKAAPGATRLQWLAGLLWWSHAGSQKHRCKANRRGKNKNRDMLGICFPRGRKNQILFTLNSFYLDLAKLLIVIRQITERL